MGDSANPVTLHLHAPDAPTQAVPITEQLALGLEQALLAADDATRQAELEYLLGGDPAIVAWARRVAWCRTGRDITAVDELAAWWSTSLVHELTAALKLSNDDLIEPTGVQWRLLALVTRLGQLEQRLEQEKLEALKELAYGASHEINNPLANIAARAQTLLDEETNLERQRKLLAIQRQAMRAHEMISDLMLFARPPQLQLCSCDMRAIVEQVFDEHRDLAAERHIELFYHLGESAVEVAADKTQLKVALAAVLINAIEAVGDGGRVEVALQTLRMGDEPWARITVRDNGPGISPEVRRHMFDPFFSGREAGRGMGFGLSKCWRIVTDHGGKVVVNQPAGSGAEIAIRLPMARHD